MEKVVSTALSEQEKEPKDGEEKAVLMTVVSNNDLASLESSQDEERTAVFLKDAKTPPNSMALLSPSKEKEIGLKETVHSSSKKPEAINREGKGTDVMGSPKEDPSFLLSFTHQEPDGTLEACAKTDELSPSLGVVTITDRRKESRSKAEHRLKFRKGCYKADSRRSADQRSTTVLWDYSTQETVGRVSKEESTLERLPGLKDSESTKDISWKNPSYSEEPTSAVESNIMKTVQMNTDDQEGELEHLEPGMAAGEVSPQLDGAQTVSGDERYHSNEPKQLESFSKEHLDRKQELENKGFQTLDWLSEHNEGLGPPYRSINKPTDVATNLSVRGQLAREASLLALPVFRKTLKPHLSKAKTAESAPSPRKGQAMNSDLGDVSPGNTAEWALQTSGIQTATDLAVRKRTWSIRGRDTVEHVRPRSAESPTGSAYDDETRPYISSLLLDEQGKEDIGQEEDPTVYTCIECSIYFKMKEHLMDHMLQHNRGLDLDQDREDAEDQCQLTCNECGWAFGDIDSLEQHRRLHQESREKIIEEIQKLDEFPDEGRDARLQCPKCVFGTNSSKVFVQHAKMHVRERKDQSLKHVNLFGNSGGSEPRDSSIHNIYRHFRPNERLPQTTHMHSSNKGHSTCMLCSFPAPNDNILKEHMKYTHSQLPWNTETFEADMNQPGTSRDTYSPNRSSRFSESDYLSKADRFFPQSHGEIIYDSPPPFPGGHHRLNKSNGSNKKEIPKPGFRARKRAPYSTSQKILEMSSLTSANAYSPHALKERNKSTMLPLDSERENAKSHPGVLEELQHKWLPINDVRSMEEEFPLATEIQLAENRYFRPFAIPQSALDLKRTFRGTLKAIDFSVASAGQQHQLRQMVPIVIVEEINLYRRKVKRPKMKTLKKKVLPLSREFGMDEPPPLGVFLLDSSLEGSLELDDLLDADSSMLKNEERKCPYCPDRFHNGIGLANHVRGHLNRVGVSYNVRHFISAEEVKAIEQKFSFQKKKKKGIANFDPGTFSLMRCEFCGAGFDTRAGLSSHARAHLRDFGITNWELTISPINILKELLANSSEHPMLQSALGTDPSSPNQDREMLGFRPCKSTTPISECSISQSPFSPFPPSWGDEPMQSFRDVMASEDEEEIVTTEMGSPPLQKKSPLAGSLDQIPNRIGGSLSPEISSNKTDSQDSKTVDSDSGRENDCQLCGAWFETRKGLSSHARAHLRHLGVSDPDAKGSPIDVLNELIKNEDFKGHLSSLLSSERESLGETESSDGPSPKSTATAAPATGMKQVHSPRPLGKQPSLLSPQSPPSSKKMKPNGHRLSAVANLQRKQGLSSSAYWASDAEMAPLNLSSGAEPVRDIRCEFCGEYFENRKGLSSHARSHLRQMGVTEWYVNGSPIDTLREIMKRRSQPRTSTSSSPAQGQKSVALPVLGSSLEPHSPGEGHVSAIPKKAHPPGSPMGHSSTSSSPPTARKIFPGLPSPSSLHKKLKQDQLHMEIKREMLSGGLHNDSHLSDRAWSPREDMSPLNLSSRADPVRDIRCEFCGEFFENRKGLSSHARSHLRQMGVTEWSVNGSPIDTLREIIKKKNKPYFIKKEPNTMSIELPKSMGDEGFDPKSHGKMLQSMTLSPLGGRTGKPNLGREVSLSPLKSQEGFFTTLSTKRPLSDERLSIHHSEMKHKTYIQTELPFKAKHMHEKPTHTSSEACCELCGLYFENRKALASHARAHLRQFGVTEWCVNGSPIETLSEWIKHRPQKAGAYRSYIQGGRPFTKKFRNASHFREIDLSGKRVPLSLHAGSPLLASRSLLGEMLPSEPSKAVDCGSSGERPVVTSPLSLVKVEEHQHHNINKFERRQAKPIEAPLPREDEASDVQQKADEARQPPLRVRPVPSLVPRPPQTSLVKFVGNIYTLKCRFCEVEFQGPLSIQEEWVRHLQRHILETNFSKADGLRSEIDVPMAPPIAEAQ
ncbi:protein Wiz isoform X7 [Anolis carolinensis]|uniref:protein Wiz isoform X7 n=1 Tax=Anolis carolinensis TaxID=28377 RepID=UPI000462A3D7|nr:PREDICTED: protein Wiz isoform X5 [Anolis carolinensis]|eukprot:XP_008102461.1 PREDICTED: protein Wiz isoform X5 [Anolis carolinensis]